MDPNESGLSSYYHQHQPIPPPLSVAPPLSGGGGGINASPTNGAVQNINTHGSVSNPTAIASTTSSPMAYSNTVPSAVSTGMEGVKKKRGRPRKYATPEEAAAAKRASNPIVQQPKKKQQIYGGGFGAGMVAGSSSSKKFQLDAQCTAGEKFKPHVITVAAGEDVNQKIMTFVHQNKGEMCILSASGTVSNAFLKQPATSGGSITYEGRYDILSLSGSYVRAEGGAKSGGLSVCLASNDGHIVGGGVGGPLTAAGPVQVIAGTFVVDNKKDNNTIGETSAGAQSPSPVGGGGTSMSGVSFRSPNDSYQNYGQYMNMQ